MSELNKESTAQAEAERPEVVGYCNPGHIERLKHMEITGFLVHEEESASISEPLITLAQHERIVGELRADRDSWAEQRLADWDEMRKERDAALSKVADEKVVAQAQALGRIVDKLTQYNESLYEENTRLLADCEKIDREVAALRARLSITPERLASGESISKMLRSIGCDGDVSYHHSKGIWNACLDELERLRRLHEK